VPAGAIADHNLGTIDLFPTLCGLAGIQTPETCTGQDFSKVFLGQPGGPDPETQLTLINNFKRNYFHSRLVAGERGTYEPFRAVRGKRYSYAVDSEGDWFIYDNKADPFQMNNLAGDPTYAKVREKMAAELESWLAKAEYPYIPEEWRALSLPERITAQNEYYCLIDFEADWEARKAEVIAPFIEDATPGQAAKIRLLADELVDRDYIGTYLAVRNERSGRKRVTELSEAELSTIMDRADARLLGELEAGVRRILS